MGLFRRRENSIFFFFFCVCFTVFCGSNDLSILGIFCIYEFKNYPKILIFEPIDYSIVVRSYILSLLVTMQIYNVNIYTNADESVTKLRKEY